MRVAQNDEDGRAGLRGHMRFYKIHVYIDTQTIAVPKGVFANAVDLHGSLSPSSGHA